MVDQQDLLGKVEPIIRSAGDIIMSYFNKQIAYKQKDDSSIVTKADIASETFIKEKIASIIPEASFLGEESGLSDTSSDYSWVIDPLDGTTNFAHDIPYFCISIALTFKGEPVFGIIYQPIMDELFYAYKGKGAFLNGKRIEVQHNPENKRVILVGLPYSKGESFMRVLHHVEDLAPKFNAFRHLGAMALDQAYVAAGRADAVFCEDLGWWDVAAGMLLIQEAGGIVTTYEGKQVRQDYHSYLGAHPDIHEQLSPILKDHAQNQ